MVIMWYMYVLCHSQRKSRQSERKHVSYGIGGGKDGSGLVHMVMVARTSMLLRLYCTHECRSFLPEVRCFLKDCHIEVYALSEVSVL